MAGRSTALALPCLYCFASVIVWTENKNVTISDHFICFILTIKQSAALAACVLTATTKMVVNCLRIKVHLQRKSWLRLCPLDTQLLCLQCKILATPLTPCDLAWGFSDLEMTWLDPLLRWRRHWNDWILATRMWTICPTLLFYSAMTSLQPAEPPWPNCSHLCLQTR